MENEEQEEKKDDIGADIAAAMEEVEGNPGEEAATETDKSEQAEQPEIQIEPAPQSWGGSVKEHWGALPENVRVEILKRENDIHQMVTRHDGELRLGREMKEVVTPYLPIIQAEGGTPATAVRDLLNTAYVLRTGTPESKKQIVLQVAKQYGVDLGLSADEEYIDPQIAALRQEINQLRQVANPQAITNSLQEQMEASRISAEIAAFASNPEHAHFDSVKSLMQALLASNQAKDLKEAYDMACNAHPQVRSTLIAAKEAENAAKRKAEMDAKRRAGSSLTGSPAATSNSSSKNNPKATVEDDLRAAFDAYESRI